MKAFWAPIIFAAGLGAGWLIFGGGMRASAEAAGNKSAAPVVTKREARPEKSPHESQFRRFAKELPKLSFEDKDAFKKSLAPADRAAAIEAMLAQAGPEGIPYDAKSMIDDILKVWVAEDFDGAWAWCQQIESKDTRKFIAAHLLDELVEKEPDRAFALYLEMAAEDPYFNSNVAHCVLKSAISKDAASFLDILGKLPFGAGTTRMEEDFAEDFDFQQAADGITALRVSHKGDPPAVFPDNFLSTWAARDADAAYAWFAKNPSGGFENFGSLLKGIEKRAPGTSYTWAAEKLSEPGDERRDIIHSLTETFSASMPSIMLSIAQAMPDTSNRDSFLSMVVTECYMNDNTFIYDPAVECAYAITQMSSAAARLETLRALGGVDRLDAAKIPDALLQQWGLTRQQVERLQPPGR